MRKAEGLGSHGTYVLLEGDRESKRKQINLDSEMCDGENRAAFT